MIIILFLFVNSMAWAFIVWVWCEQTVTVKINATHNFFVIVELADISAFVYPSDLVRSDERILQIKTILNNMTSFAPCVLTRTQRQQQHHHHHRSCCCCCCYTSYMSRAADSTAAALTQSECIILFTLLNHTMCDLSSTLFHFGQFFYDFLFNSIICVTHTHKVRAYRPLPVRFQYFNCFFTGYGI